MRPPLGRGIVPTVIMGVHYMADGDELLTITEATHCGLSPNPRAWCRVITCIVIVPFQEEVLDVNWIK